MKFKQLGESKLNVSALCFGGNVFGWTINEATSFQLLDQFVAAGGNFIDTANIYSAWAPGNQGGESEVIIGKWLSARKNRDKVVLATKVGAELSDKTKGLSKRYIFSQVEASLRRLQTDFIDLYISHRPDSTTPIEETLGAYGELIKSGKIRVCGASNYDGNGLQAAMEKSRSSDLPRYQSLQPQYNLYDREDYETNLLPICEKYHLGVTPYFSLASGFLTGKYRTEADFSKSKRGGGMTKYMNPRGMKILAALDKVAKETSSTPTAVALSWLMSRPTVTSAIASATNGKQLEDLIASTQLDLTASALAELNV